MRSLKSFSSNKRSRKHYNTWSIWDQKYSAASANLIKQHFLQIWGRDGATCAHLMHVHAQPPAMRGSTDNCAESFDEQMIKQYLIIKPTELLTNLPVLDVEPPLKCYTCKAVEDNAQCFQELKHIVRGTETEVNVDKFNIHLESGLPGGSCITLSFALGQRICLHSIGEGQTYSLVQQAKTWINTYFEHHKQVYQSMLALSKKTNYATSRQQKRSVYNFIQLFLLVYH